MMTTRPTDAVQQRWYFQVFALTTDQNAKIRRSTNASNTASDTAADRDIDHDGDAGRTDG